MMTLTFEGQGKALKVLIEGSFEGARL